MPLADLFACLLADLPVSVEVPSESSGGWGTGLGREGR